jgi:hypothetical protein
LFDDFNALFSRSVGVRFWHPDFVDTIAAKAADPYWRNAAFGIIAMVGD